MDEIEGQLRAYVTAVLDRVEPVSADEVTERIPSPGRPPRRRVLVAAVALVVALLVVSTTWIVWRSSGTGVDRVTSGRGDLKGLPTDWTRIDALRDAQINAASSSPSGVVAVGSGIWFSRDAQTWTQALDPAEVGAAAAVQPGSVWDVTPSGRGFVAAGQATDPGSGQAVAAIWSSPDGQRWARVRDPDLEPPTPSIPPTNSSPIRGSIDAVTRGGAGFVAVGRVFAGTFRGGTLGTAPYEPAIWTSHNGSAWKRVDVTNAVGKGPSSWKLSDVFEFDGSIFATAAVDNVTVVLESSDGDSWRRASTHTGTFARVVRHRGSLVAVGSQSPIAGSEYYERAAIWFSRDARRWKRVFLSAPALHSHYGSVAVRGRSLVAVGIFGNQEVFVDGIMSVSNDGRAWQPVETMGTAFAPNTVLSAAAAFGDRYLAFGSVTTVGENNVYMTHNEVFLSEP